MKYISVILSLALFISCEKKDSANIQNNSLQDNITAKNKTASTQNDSIKTIEDIRKEYTKLNTLLTAKKLDSTKLSYNCDETEREGEVVFYYQNKKLKIVKNSYSEHSHFSSSTHYYIKDDQVFFVFNDETIWNFDEGGTPEKPETKDDVEEKRLYYINNQLVSCRDKKYTLRTKNHSKHENISDGESKNCDDSELKKTFEAILKNKDKKGEIKCL